jgi:hypothetical protein
MRRAAQTTIFIALTCFMVVCTGRAFAQGKGSSPSDRGCQVNVTGAVTSAFKGVWQEPVDDQSSNVAAVADYWFSELDLIEVIESFIKPGEHKSKKLVLGMRKNPRFVILQLNCMTDDGHVFLRPAPKSIYQDVPRKARSYKVVEEGKATPGQFVASSVKVGKDYYQVTGGKIDLAKFNMEGVTGTFSLKAVPFPSADQGKTINLEGTFNFPCTGVGSRCRSK